GVGRRQPRFEYAGHGFAVAAARADSGERVARRAALVGTVVDLPVTQLAASTQADAAGADAAEGERQHRELVAGEGAGIADALSGLARARRRLRCGEFGNGR